MQVKTDILGDVIKAARQSADITVEVLAERVGVTERYLYRIENEGKRPSYDVLYKLIRALSVPPDRIFFPEKAAWETETESLIRMLCVCDKRSLEVIKATARALIETAK